MNALPEEAGAVLDLWFGTLDADGLADSDHKARWWKKDPDFDAQLKRRFGELHARLASVGLAEEWATPRGRLAALIVLDQFSRNMFRGSGEMFAFDAQALRIAAELRASGEDRALATHERVFAYMPFMHSESLADQQRCLELFTALRDESTGPAAEAVAANVDFAQRHLEIVERFGRFPHRNALLGRESTAEERAFLEQPGSSF